MTTTTNYERALHDAEDFASRHYEDLPHHKRAAEDGFIAGRTVTKLDYRMAADLCGLSTYEARELLKRLGILIEGEA